MNANKTIGDAQALQTLTTHTSDINSVDFAGDCILVTGSGDKRVRVWEWRPTVGYVETYFSPLLGHKYGVTSVKVSPQSTMLASSSIDGTTLLWNLRTGSKIHTMVQTGGEAVRVCRFSQDSMLLATAGDNGQVCLWDLIRRNLIRCFQKHDGAIQSICFSPDSSWLITSCTLGVLKLFATAEIVDCCMTDSRAITTFASVDDAHDLGVVSCDFSPFQEVTCNEPCTKLYQLVSCGHDHYVKLWEVTVSRAKCDPRASTAKINLCRILEKHSSALTCVRFSSNGLYIASTSLDKTAVIWETVTGKLLTTISGHNRYVACCAFSRDGNLLATGSNDKTVIVWDLTGKLCLNSELARPFVSMLSVDDRDKSAKHEQDVMSNAEISSNEVKLIQRLDEHIGAVNSVAFYGNRLIASGSGDKLVRIWAVKTEQETEQRNVQGDDDNNKDQIVEEEEKNEEENEEEGEEEQHEEQNEEEEEEEQNEEEHTEEEVEEQKAEEDSMERIQFLEEPFSPMDGHKYSVNHVEFSPCGTMLASCSLDGTTIIWNTESGNQERSAFVNSGSGVRVCRWSPDGTKIATAGDDEKTTLWDVDSIEQLCVFEGHTDAVNAIAFTHDSRYLATACNEGSWRLFDTLNDKSSIALMVCEEAHDLGVQGCDFSPTSGSTINGREADTINDRSYLLATSGNDSLVKLWQITVCNENKFSREGTGTSDIGIRYKEQKTLSGHGGNVTNVRFAPVHGEILGSVATDRTARIWSVFSAACLYVLEDHNSLVTSCAFSEDTSLFITGALDKTILIWKIPQQLVSQSMLIDNLRCHKKKVADWRVDDTVKWLNETGLSILTRRVRRISLTGRLLLAVSEDVLVARLQIDQDETAEAFKTQLYWLKREDSNATPVAMDDAEIPHEFLCPITHEIMKEPVQCTDGFTYERAAINEWFLCGKYTSPMTNDPLQDTSITPNVRLRNAICMLLHGNRSNFSTEETGEP